MVGPHPLFEPNHSYCSDVNTQVVDEVNDTYATKNTTEIITILYLVFIFFSSKLLIEIHLQQKILR